MDFILLAAALVPAIALMAYVYSKDRVEPEPIGLVLRVFLLGAASGLVAGMLEGVLIDIFEATIPSGFILLAVTYFIGVAAVEEACKFACLHSVRNHPAFDYLFDAIVYSVAAALGFAALENVFYVFDGGLETAFWRAILSVPGHAADGVVMGVFYGIARQRQLHGRPGAGVYYLLAWLLPVLEHGFYDAALSTESDLMAMVAMVFDWAFIVLAFVLVKRASAADEPLRPQVPQQQPVQVPYRYSQQQWPQQPVQQHQQQYQRQYPQQYQQQLQPWAQPQQQQPQQQQHQYQPQPNRAGAPEPPARTQNGPTVRYSSRGDGDFPR